MLKISPDTCHAKLFGLVAGFELTTCTYLSDRKVIVHFLPDHLPHAFMVVVAPYLRDRRSCVLAYPMAPLAFIAPLPGAVLQPLTTASTSLTHTQSHSRPRVALRVAPRASLSPKRGGLPRFTRRKSSRVVSQPSAADADAKTAATSSDTAEPDTVVAALGRDGARRRQKTSPIGVMFFFITYFWGVVHFVPVLLSHPLVLILDRHRRRFTQFCGMSWLRTSLASVAIRPVVLGCENLPAKGETVVYVANHASNMDIYILPFLGRAMKVVCKAEIFKMPVIGWAMRMAGNIGVVRADGKAGLEAFRRMVESLVEHRTSVFIYPEGTRSASGKMARWKPGAFRAAIAAGVSVVPVTITGTREMMPAHALTPLRYPSAIEVTVHPAISSLGRSAEELRDAAYRAVEEGLDPAFRTGRGAMKAVADIVEAASGA